MAEILPLTLPMELMVVLAAAEEAAITNIMAEMAVQTAATAYLLIVRAALVKVQPPVNLVNLALSYMLVVAVVLRINLVRLVLEEMAAEVLAACMVAALHLVLQTLAEVAEVSVTPKTMALAVAASLSSARLRIKEVPQ